MNDTKKLRELRKRPSLPVSIPIHIYHRALRMASAKSDSKNSSDQQFPTHNEQKENQPKQANMITAKKVTANKATLTEDRNETITIESPKDDKCKCGEFSSDRQFHILLDNFLNIVRQKKIIYVNISTQTDDVTDFLHDDKADNEEFKERSKDTQSKKGPDIYNEIESFSQEFKTFLFQLYSSTQRLFKENISNNKRTFVYSQDTRVLFLKIINSVVDLITRDEKTIKDFSNNTTAAADIVQSAANNNNNKETPKEIVNLVLNNNNNDNNDDNDATLTQTQTAQNIIKENNSPEVEENNHVQEDSSNTEHSFIAEQFAPNTLVQRDPQPPQTENYSNQTSYEIVQQSNVLNAQLNFNNNAYNPQSARRLTHTPRPQIMHQHQLHHKAEYIYDYQNKMCRYPEKNNIRPTPYHQKSQKRKTGQQLGIEPFQSVPMQHAYYQATTHSPQQLNHQQMQYQQNFH